MVVIPAFFGAVMVKIQMVKIQSVLPYFHQSDSSSLHCPYQLTGKVIFDAKRKPEALACYASKMGQLSAYCYIR